VGVMEDAPRVPAQRGRRGPIQRMASMVYHAAVPRRPSLEALCVQARLPYRLIYSSNDPGLLEWVEALEPDLIVVHSMSRLLGKELFSLPRYGSINLHAAYLPEYRGPNPCLWQYVDMERRPGVTVHYIDEGEDTGDIIFQERVEIPVGIKSPARLDKLVGAVGVRLLLKAVKGIEDGTAPRIRQPARSPTSRARNLRPDEHATLIDWALWPGLRVWNVLCGTESWLNALPPPPGWCSGSRWIIGKFEANACAGHVPGVIYKEGGRHFVATKDGRIHLATRFSLIALANKVLSSWK
jgi:methionyl-tRNA formyltransferase